MAAVLSLPQQRDRGTHESEQAGWRRAGGDEGEREGEEQKRDGQGRQGLDQDEARLPVPGPYAAGSVSEAEVRSTSWRSDWGLPLRRRRPCRPDHWM